MRKKKILSRKAEKILRRSYNLAITAVIVIILLIYKAKAYLMTQDSVVSNEGPPTFDHGLNKSLYSCHASPSIDD